MVFGIAIGLSAEFCVHSLLFFLKAYRNRNDKVFSRILNYFVVRIIYIFK